MIRKVQLDPFAPIPACCIVYAIPGRAPVLVRGGAMGAEMGAQVRLHQRCA